MGRRPDGYHDVKTLLQTISLQDELHFELSEDRAVTLSCDNPDIPTGSDNLIVRAADALRERFQVERGIRVRLEKRIPIKAGLGGASSNAAVTLLALKRLWQLKAAIDDLLEIAAKLGADVPFFLLGGCVEATGTGTTLSPLASAAEPVRRYLIVITPNAGISTPAAYKALDAAALTTKNTNPILSVSQSEANSGHSQPWTLGDSLKNDFESVIFDIEPEIRRTKKTLLQAGALGASLAGSGSSVFGIFADEEDQQRAANEIQLEAGWRMFPCVTVSQTEYLRAVGS